MSGKFVPMTEELQEHVTCHSDATRRGAVGAGRGDGTAGPRAGHADCRAAGQLHEPARASHRGPAPSRLAPSRAIARSASPAPCRKTASCCAAMSARVDRHRPSLLRPGWCGAQDRSAHCSGAGDPGRCRTISRSSTSASSMPTSATRATTTRRSSLRLRPGGILCVDNVLRDGRVVDPRENDPPIYRAVRALNDALPRDPRVEVVMLPIADGLTIIRKK